jgi:hypothetical protein
MRPETALQLTNKLQACIDRTFREIVTKDYEKGGHVVTFDIEHDCADWTATVYDLISCAQRMGHGWSIKGFIDEELDLIATGTSIPGVKMVSCFCPRPGTQNAK